MKVASHYGAGFTVIMEFWKSWNYHRILFMYSFWNKIIELSWDCYWVIRCYSLSFFHVSQALFKYHLKYHLDIHVKHEYSKWQFLWSGFYTFHLCFLSWKFIRHLVYEIYEKMVKAWRFHWAVNQVVPTRFTWNKKQMHIKSSCYLYSY